MNRALARRLLAVPVLLWAALSTTPAVADSCAYAVVGTGDDGASVEAYAYAGSAGRAAARGGGHHDGGPGKGGGHDK
ncbi:hypothetical protein IPZ70_33335, partial [Streptomyces polychromogenes]|nr:hypothetical protein [Streptomyces polychromogenes]